MNEGLVVCVRAIISFFTLLIFTRILGKEQISQLTYFDYIVGITIGSIASEVTTDLSSRAWPHWVGLFTWKWKLMRSMTIGIHLLNKQAYRRYVAKIA